MSTVYGLNYTAAYVNNGKIRPGEQNGHKKVLFEEYTFAAELLSGSTLKIGKLPKGARVISATLKSPDLGGTGTIDVGTLASDGGDAADPDAFIAAADASGQAVHSVGAGAGLLAVKYAGEVVVEALFTGGTVSATGKTIRFAIEYIVD